MANVAEADQLLSLSCMGRWLAAILFAVGLGGTLMSCTGSDGSSRDGGFKPGPITDTITVWHDAHGLYTCPPGSLIGASLPPSCDVDVADRVRLDGAALDQAIAPARPDAGRFVTSVRVIGKVDGTGYAIDVDRATLT